jgi:hypothetical protein
MLALFAGWLIFWLLTNVFIKVRDHPPGEEAMQSLHAIQLAVERYHADEHRYPEFLIGGTTEWDDTSRYPIAADGDTLAFLGYMPVYPDLDRSGRDLMAQEIPIYSNGRADIMRRVFLNERSGIAANPGDFKRLQDVFGDKHNVESHHSRFIDETSRARMGNLAADHRYENARWGFPYWLRETGSKDLITVTSQFNFYYKSLKSPGADRPDGYILMVFGPHYEKGQDTFTTVPGGHELDGRLPDGTGIGMGVPVIPQLGLEPDGKPDGVTIVLHGGWPWEE